MTTEQTTKYWYALYTKPRWEKKVHELMRQRGMESYCPLNKVRKKWSDRYKIVEEPLFKSYVFIRAGEQERNTVRFVEGVVNFVYWLGKPAVVRDEDIEKIKRFLNEYGDVLVEPIENLKPGTDVIITSGVFMDQSAKVVSDRNKTVILEIVSLGCRLVAQVPKEQVMPVGRADK
ncbi:UpxY family transcription antiterminator [Flavihumibacter profundi]|uniref:UpxY family transcription antiterminator n=1 Tax=Flavihumibacter profundi TaxID=2716883 RepID=UPI001CC539B6|nr:UpxY family transcription antiterminator [Flavihumibacter profundi]MBZ5857982.1 UpxY family transcription antiterminator [Flavihumibacter profundi]